MMNKTKKNKISYIYLLYDPTFVSKKVYVGKTTNPLRRWREHITNKDYNDTHKDRWIKKLLIRNALPELKVIYIVPKNKNWKRVEKKFISLLKWCGIKLANSTSGGAGVSNPIKCVRDKMSRAKKKYNNLKLHKIWYDMINSCYNTKAAHYSIYGAKGIGVCVRWRSSYYYFEKDMGDCPKNHYLTRINTSSNFEVSNVMWATAKERKKFNKQSYIWIFNNKEYTTPDLAKLFGFNIHTIWTRIQRKYDIEKIWQIPKIPQKWLYNGKEYSTSQLAKKLKISIDIVRKKIAQDYSIVNIWGREIKKIINIYNNFIVASQVSLKEEKI